MPPDGAFKTHTSLRETLNQADLDLPYFRTTEQNSPGLMQFANRNPPEPPYTGKLMSPTNHHLVAAKKDKQTLILISVSYSMRFSTDYTTFAKQLLLLTYHFLDCHDLIFDMFVHRFCHTHFILCHKSFHDLIMLPHQCRIISFIL